MKNLLPKRVYITVILLVLSHLVLSELCGRNDAALVVLGAGGKAMAPAIAAMIALLLCRLALFLVVPGWVMAHVTGAMLKRKA